MSVRVSAVIVDNSLPGGEPRAVQFDHDGNWYEALDQLVHEYSVQHRGGMRNIDADRLELRHCAIINLGDIE